MPGGPGVQGYIPSNSRSGKKGPATYKAAKARSEDRGSFANLIQKAKTDKRISKVDKKIKRVSNKIIGYKSKPSGKAAYNRY